MWDPNNTVALANVGTALYHKNNYTGVNTILDKALTIDPNDFYILHNNGLFLSKVENYTGA